MEKAFTNYYKSLGLKNTATIDDIKKAYRAQAKEFHPDKNPSTAAKIRFEEIQTAYDNLKDDTKKKIYDNILAAKLEDLKRYEMQDKNEKEMANDLLRREEEYVKNKIKEQQKVYRDKYEAKVNRKRQVEDLLSESSKHTTQDKYFTVAVKWRHKSKVFYTNENLRLIFAEYGRIDDVLLANEKHRAYIMFAYKDSVVKLLQEKEKFANQFTIKAIKEMEQKKTEINTEGFLSTDLLNKMRIANEKKSFDTIKEDISLAKKKKVEETTGTISMDDFKKKEEEILKKLLEG